MKEIHFSCLGALCDDLYNPHIKISDFKTKEEYLSNFTLDVNRVTYEKCRDILRKQGIPLVRG